MELFPTAHRVISKYLRSEAGMRLKDFIRPAKHALFGKKRLYKVIEMAHEMEKQNGNDVTVVFDIGAAIGEAALPMAREFPNAKIYCFEPLPDSFARLKKRTAKFVDRIQYFNYGLHNKDDNVEFHVFPHRDASSILPVAHKGMKKILVRMRRLDDVARELEIGKIHFMKVDVEGVEKEVFEGGRETLKRVDNIFVEIVPALKGRNSRDYIDVFEQLHNAGFSFAGVWEDFFFSKLV